MKKLSVVILLVSFSGCLGSRSVPPRAASSFPLLNPLLAADPSLEFSELRPFRYKVKALIADHKKKGDATHVSVYFRDLENGPLFGLDMDEKFSPVSLLKVPLMMAVLKEAETNPGLLERRLLNDQPQIGRPDIDGAALERGKEYTIDDLVRAMIVSSDNDAVMMLRTVVGDAALNAVFSDFGLIIPEVRSLDDSMTVREYATFFRVLYNAAYLDKPLSQKALEYLAATRFKGGLVAGVPPGIAVAHKFGERSFADSAAKQLHDCGIIYHPSRPYVLCVMSRGTDFDKLSAVIRDVSALTYAEITAQRK